MNIFYDANQKRTVNGLFFIQKKLLSLLRKLNQKCDRAFSLHASATL